MSQFYGLLAGLFVGLATWAATVYVNELAGLVVGLFLLTFFAVSTIYMTGDELLERQRTFSEALVQLESSMTTRLREIEHAVRSAGARTQVPLPMSGSAEPDVQTLNTMLQTLDAILDAGRQAPSGSAIQPQSQASS